MTSDSRLARWRSRLSPTLLMALVLWVFIAGWFLDTVGSSAVDDMYITYRYARNLASGDGFVFNPGERVFGLTNPGVGLLLAAGHLLTRVPIPNLAAGLFAAALIGLALLVAIEARTRGRLPEALAAGTLMLCCGFIWISRGSAQPLAVLLLATAAVAARRRPWLAGLLAGFAVWMRPEAGLGVGVLGVMLWIEDRRLPWRYGVAAAAVILAGLGLAQLYFGTPIPNTLAAKQGAEMMTGRNEPGTTFWPKAIRSSTQHMADAAQPLIVLGLLGLGVAFRRGGRGLRTVVLYAATLLIAFPAFSVGYFIWYALPTVVGLFYGAAYAAGEIARGLTRAVVGDGSREARPVASAALALALGIGALLPLAVPLVERSWELYSRPYRPPPRLAMYEEMGAWLRQKTPEGTRVAHMEIGVLGWESERPLQDLVGLVTPESIPYLEQRKIAGALLHDPADYVVVPSRGWFHAISQLPWFRRGFELAAEFTEPRTEEVLRLYRKRPGARLPPPPPLVPLDQGMT